MATSAFFISETYLKDNSPLNNAVDMTDVYPFAKTAEEVYIQEAIGTCLYDDLIAKIIASKASPPTVMSTVDIDLCKKIRSCMVWLTTYDALPFIWVKIRNIGLVKQNGDNLETTSQAEMTYIRSQIKNKQDFYLRLLQSFLCENSADYPEYTCSCADCSGVGPNTNVSNSMGIVLDGPKNDLIVKKWFR